MNVAPKGLCANNNTSGKITETPSSKSSKLPASKS
jgi:hypothetical protein